MRQILVVLLMFVFLLTGCNSAKTDSTTLGTENNPEVNEIPSAIVDLLYENIAKLDDFQCDVIYSDENVTISGERAKELYHFLSSKMYDESENAVITPGENFVYLVFYTGQNYLTDATSACYGAYSLYEDGLLRFSSSPLYSSGDVYKSDAEVYHSVIDFICDEDERLLDTELFCRLQIAITDICIFC